MVFKYGYQNLTLFGIAFWPEFAQIWYRPIAMNIDLFNKQTV